MRRSSGFSLMEMMVVLLIVAIIAAASAPMIAKKSLSAAAEKSPWVWTKGGSIAYNLAGEEQTAVIGGVMPPFSENNPLLYLKTGSDKPQLTLGGSGGYLNIMSSPKGTGIGFSSALAKPSLIGEDTISIGSGAKASVDRAIAIGGYYETFASAVDAIAIGAGATASKDGAISIGSGATAEGDKGIAIGSERAISKGGITIGELATVDKIHSSSKNVIAIGRNVSAKGENSTAVGTSTVADNAGATALGHSANARNNYATAIGYDAVATGLNSSALGYDSDATETYSTAIGYKATASGLYSTALGYNAKATLQNQIVLGNEYSTVYIPGNLVVEKKVELSKQKTGVWMGIEEKGGGDWIFAQVRRRNGSGYDDLTVKGCDRRLKNVGKVFVGGLEEIKKLEVFNFTYKKDPEKTPRVGVMAQDLQKIFPNAVFKGDDGFLRIRMEDMFYALVNAVKELDRKIEEFKTQEIITLKNRVDKLEKENKALEKRLSELEKKVK